jgi:hypothetical protein
MRFILFCALIIGLKWALYTYYRMNEQANQERIKKARKAMCNIQL